MCDLNKYLLNISQKDVNAYRDFQKPILLLIAEIRRAKIMGKVNALLYLFYSLPI